MAALFEAVQRLMQGNPLLMLFAAFLWGVLSVALSPCHLTSIPLIIGFVDSAEVKTTGRRFLLALLFSVGILLSIALIGVATASAGRIAGDLGAWTNWLAAGIFALIGLSFLDVIPLTINGINGIPIAMKGRRAALLIGLIFGIALGPCTFAFMAPVLAATLASDASSTLSRALLIGAYGIGHSLLIVLAGTFTGALQKYLQWNSKTQHAETLKKAAGVLLLMGALYFLAK